MITEEDILDCIDVGDLVRMESSLSNVKVVYCNCCPDFWEIHFHANEYICLYDINKKGINHTRAITEIFKRSGKNYVRFAHKKNGRLILDKEVEE